MVKKYKWILLVIILVVVVAGAGMLYNNLSKDYNYDSTQGYEKNSSQNEKVQAPNFVVLDYQGNEVSLDDFKGKPVVLNFWATWCNYCKVEMPDFDKAYKEYPEVQFMMIDATDGVQETIDGAKAYVEDNNFEFDVFFDTKLEAVNNYYVTGFPMTFFIDADGYVVAKANGMINYETLDKWIKITMGEETP